MNLVTLQLPVPSLRLEHLLSGILPRLLIPHPVSSSSLRLGRRVQRLLSPWNPWPRIHLLLLIAIPRLRQAHLQLQEPFLLLVSLRTLRWPLLPLGNLGTTLLSRPSLLPRMDLMLRELTLSNLTILLKFTACNFDDLYTTSCCCTRNAVLDSQMTMFDMLNIVKFNVRPY